MKLSLLKQATGSRTLQEKDKRQIVCAISIEEKHEKEVRNGINRLFLVIVTKKQYLFAKQSGKQCEEVKKLATKVHESFYQVLQTGRERHI